MKMIKTRCSNSKQSGFTLLEILIAVLVLSIGLLGLAALQLTGLKHNQSSQYRSMATTLAYDMADRIRANKTAEQAGDYAIAFGTAPSGSATNCSLSACATDAMATYDMAYWKCSLGNWNNETICGTTGTNLAIKGDLPSGDGLISKTGDIYTISVRWDDNRSGSADTTFSMRFRP